MSTENFTAHGEERVKMSKMFVLLLCMMTLPALGRADDKVYEPLATAVSQAIGPELVATAPRPGAYRDRIWVMVLTNPAPPAWTDNERFNGLLIDKLHKQFRPELPDGLFFTPPTLSLTLQDARFGHFDPNDLAPKSPNLERAIQAMSHGIALAVLVHFTLQPGQTLESLTRSTEEIPLSATLVWSGGRKDISRKVTL